MEIRKAKKDEYNEAVQLLCCGRRNIAALGIDQWQNGDPSESDIEKDIENGNLYVAEENGKLLGMCYIGFYENDYDYVYWGSFPMGEYVVMHRVAVDTESRGKGVFKALVKNAEKIAKENGKTQIRIDTHKGNSVMQKALKNNGFCRSGVIYLKNGDERVAFIKILD